MLSQSALRIYKCTGHWLFPQPYPQLPFPYSSHPAHFLSLVPTVSAVILDKSGKGWRSSRERGGEGRRGEGRGWMICTPTFLPSPPIYDILEEACTEKALHGRQQHHATESRRFRFSRKAYISHRQATANALACRHASNRTIQLAGLTSCRSSIAPL